MHASRRFLSFHGTEWRFQSRHVAELCTFFYIVHTSLGEVHHTSIFPQKYIMRG